MAQAFVSILWCKIEIPTAMKCFLQFLFFLLVQNVVLFAQTTVLGRVTDASGNPLVGANVYIKGHFDGDATDTEGRFNFSTNQNGQGVLMATFMGYEPQEKPIDFKGDSLENDLVLKPSTGCIGDVVITAGLFEAGDRKKSITLNPLDIVTTPSAEGDIYGALMALPGTSVVGEDGLF